MLSAWIAEQGLHCVMKVGMWDATGADEPRAWGVLLADVVRHIADAHQKEFGRDHEEVVAEIVASLERELDEPSSSRSGGFNVGHS